MAHELKAKSFQVPRITLLALFFAITVFLASSCSTETELKGAPVPEPEPEEEPLAFEILRSYMAGTQTVGSCTFMHDKIALTSLSNDKLSDLELVIGSEAQFDTLMHCEDTVNIDFNKEFILAGISTLQPNQIRINTQIVELVNDTVFYRIGLLSSPFHAPSRAEYVVKVSPRNHIQYPVIFSIYLEQ